jgi:elongation factor Tu
VDVTGFTAVPVPAVCAGIATACGRVEYATVGEHVAVSLDGQRREQLRPGQILTPPGAAPPPRRRLTGLAHLPPIDDHHSRPATDRCTVVIRGAAIPGRVHVHPPRRYLPADIVAVDVELDEPLPAYPGLRFTTRDATRTVAAGVITTGHDRQHLPR